MQFRLVMSLVLGLSLAVSGLWPRGLGGVCAKSCTSTLIADAIDPSGCCCAAADSTAPASGCCCSEPVSQDACCAQEATDASCCSEALTACACSAESGCPCSGVLQRGGDCRCPSTPSTLLAGRGSSLESITAQGRAVSGDVGYPSLTVPVRISVAVGERCVPQRAYRPAGIRAQTNVRTI